MDLANPSNKRLGGANPVGARETQNMASKANPRILSRLTESDPAKQGICFPGALGSWLGTNSTVLNEVSVNRDYIVGTHSLVNRDLPGYSVAVEVPTRIFRNWKV